MRRFVLNRIEDVHSFSGTGRVAEGVRFSDGKVAIRWLTNIASTVIWDSVEDALTVHGHDGKTVLLWVDDADTPKNQIIELASTL